MVIIVLLPYMWKKVILVQIININSLSKNNNILSNLLNEYELVKDNLFNQIKNCLIDWHDENSIAFEEKIISEKQKTNQFISNVREYENINNYVIDKYSKLFKNIKYDQIKYEKYIYAFNSSINKVEELINIYSQINITSECVEYDRIIYLKNKIFQIKNRLQDAKNKVVEFVKKIKEIEIELKNKINKIELVKVNDFDFSIKNLNITFNDDHFINIDLIENDIKYIDFYSNEEREKINSILNVLDKCANDYSSDYSQDIKNNVSYLSDNIKVLFNNRRKYIDSINEAKTFYIENSII